ncbi:MAG: alginate lyase family protein [Chthoniobacteraceae bacterium]|nr:alginate lyase family protein [Chthoniobacteraceae bacterium]
MIAYKSILSEPVSKELFHACIEKRFASKAKSVRDQAERIQREFPQLKADTIRQADMALEGMLVLPGTGGKPYFVGNPPAWADNPVNDAEYVWGLNRMAHWIPLLRAFSLTGNATYARKVVEELRNWLQCCPRPPMTSHHFFGRVDPWRSLEAGIRMFTSWPLIIPHLAGTAFLSPDLLTDYAASVFEHGEVLYHIAPQQHPGADHNHYLMQSLGLLVASCLFPEFSTAEKWRAHAVCELERCAAVQISEEGGQIEGCPHYHSGCVGWFSLGLSVAEAHGIPLSTAFISKIKKGIDYAMYALRPSGTTVSWGDSDAENAGPIHAALDGYRLFHNPDYLQIAVNCCGVEAVNARCIEAAWDGYASPETLAAIDEAAIAPKEISLPTGSWQKRLKQAMLRTGWSHDAASVFFACRTPVENTHSHIDPMSFDFTAYGRTLIVDPGRFTYREDADRREFKSAAYHNTLIINGRDPFEYISSWEYGPQKPGDLLDVIQKPGCQAVFARHDNYEPATHFRAMAIVGDALLVVLDWVENLSPGDLLQLYFHLDSTKVSLDEKTGRAETQDAGVTNVVLVPGAGFEGELLPGRVSDFIDIAHPSTRLRLTALPSDNPSRAFATVVAPWPASSARPVVSAPRIVWKNRVPCCEFQVNGKSYSLDFPQP